MLSAYLNTVFITVVATAAQLFIASLAAYAFAKKEFDIIELLSQNPGQVFDKERIYERVWGLDGTGDASLVAERVRRIRAGLAAAGAKPYIQTVWGCGYKWVE